MSIKQIYNELDKTSDFEKAYTAYGWVRTCRTSSGTLGFCNLNDGSNPEGLQIVISDNSMKQEDIDKFFKSVKIGAFLNCVGKNKAYKYNYSYTYSYNYGYGYGYSEET